MKKKIKTCQIQLPLLFSIRLIPFLICFILLFVININPVKSQDQKVEATGIIADENAEPLIGVNVVIKGTTIGAVTDINGQFRIYAVQGDTLQVSYVGYTTQNIPVTSEHVLSIILKEDVARLEEVLVIGYGTVKRANLVGSVANISTDEVEDIPAANLSTILEGRMAGIHIGQATGRPGASTSLRIRIGNTYSGINEPLYVIDGFIRDKTIFDILDPSEIESISILKDASAAVYGVRGAYGVVLVKTKMGREGPTRVNYSGSYGISDVTQITDMLNAYDHAVMLNEMWKITDPGNYDTLKYTDDELDIFKNLDYNWLDGAWKPSSLTRHTINVSGGTEHVRYFGGGSFYYETGNFKNLNVNKHTIRFGIEVDIIKGLTAGFNISLNNKKVQLPFYKGDDSSEPLENTFSQLLTAPRWLPSYIDGLPVGQIEESEWWNPEAAFNTNSYKRGTTKGNDVGASLTYKFPWIENLTARITFNRGENHAYGKQYLVPYTLYNFLTTGLHGHVITNELNPEKPTIVVLNRERIFEDYDFGSLYQFNASVSYSRDMGQHHIDGMVVYEQSETSGYQFRAIREKNLIPGMELQKGFDPNTATTTGWMNESGRLSTIGRLNYWYAQKYIVEATFRYEGSVLFSPAERWGFFPSVAVGWVVSEEDFFRNNLRFANYMKIRASAGLLGNDNVGGWQWKYSFAPAGEYLFGNTLVSGLEPQNSGVVSTGVSWEKTGSYNAGIDMRFLNNSLSVSFDAFYKYTWDILAARNSELPTTTGIDKMPRENYGEMKAWGYDMQIGYEGRLEHNIRWFVKANFEFATNRVLRKPQSAGVIGTWKDEIGKPGDGYETGFVVDGIIATQEQLNTILEENPGFTIFGATPELGMLNFQDIGRPGNTAAGELPYVFEPDGVVNDYDMKHIVVPNMNLHWKNLLPGSFSLGGSWKGIKIEANFNTAWGIEQAVVDKNARAAPTTTLNVPSFWIDYWTPENTDAAYPSPAWGGDNKETSTFWIRDVKELRLRFLNLSYQLPRSLSNQWKIPELRIYFTGTNLWTPISTFDYKDDAIAKFNSYPLMRTFNFGLSIAL
jgi:TonB-linked SusC/RagA family outer membrane protein